MGDRVKSALLIASTAIGALASIVQVVDFLRSAKTSTVLISAGFIFAAIPIIVFVALAIQTGSSFIWNGFTKTAMATGSAAALCVLALTVVLIRAPEQASPSTEAGASSPIQPATQQAPPVSTSPQPSFASITFKRPSGQTVEPALDQPITGTVAGLQGDALWIVTRPDAGGGRYYLTLSKPVTTRDGDWQFTDPEVGDDSDRGGNIVYVGVQANAACSAALTVLPADPGLDDLQAFSTFPPGCHPLEPQAALHISTS